MIDECVTNIHSLSTLMNTCGAGYFLPGEKGEQGKNVHYIYQTHPYKTLNSANDYFPFPPYEHLWGDLGDPGPTGKTILKTTTQSFCNMLL